MDENERGIHPVGEGATAGSRETLHDRIGAERDAARSVASDARRTLNDEASVLGDEAKEAAADQAEKAKEAATSHLDGFADALRAASDELGRNQGGPAAEMVANAASGLEGLARSLHGKSTGEMVESIRQFGRANPIAFLAGSALAGLALGRFATAAPSAARAQPTTASQAGSEDSLGSKPGTTRREWRPEGEPVRASVAPEAGAWSTTGSADR